MTFVQGFAEPHESHLSREMRFSVPQSSHSQTPSLTPLAYFLSFTASAFNLIDDLLTPVETAL